MNPFSTCGTVAPARARFRASLASALLSLLILTGCATPMQWGQPVVPSARDRVVLEAWRQTFPQKFRLSQRVIVTARGKEYDFLAYLRVRGNSFDASAFGEMGGTLFEFVSEDDERRIKRKPPGLPPKPLADGVIADIAHVFLLDPPEEDWTASLTSEGNRRLAWRTPPNNRAFLDYAPESGLVVASGETRNGRTIRRVRYDAWDRPDPAAPLLPHRIRVQNLRWHYEMDVRVLKFEPETPDP
ncbi:DUF3261 domain-containing protein [bacterium]|nr:DUF3261 domain-containing protein [bacterium]